MFKKHAVQRFSVFVLLVCVLTADVVLAKRFSSLDKAKEKAVEFTLKDQFGKELIFKFPKEKPSVLAIADKKGSEQLESWLRPILERYGERIEAHGVAELSNVPAIARGVVRGAMKRDVKQPVLLDWKGDVAKNYAFQKDQANIILINKDGRIIVKEIGVADADRLEKLYKEIDALLEK
jgi:hypothetical protein